MEPMIVVDLASKVPIYRQIIEQVRRLVANGQLAPGAELPSLRQLAVDLNVNVNTVALAYRELERQGIVRLRQGARATINQVDRQRLIPDDQMLQDLREQMERIRTNAQLAGISLTELARLAHELFAPEPPGPAKGAE